MFDEQAAQRAFQDVHRIWVEPEIRLRRERGEWDAGFRIYKCLILLPPNGPPIVQFNEEVGWTGTTSLAPSIKFKKGDEVLLSHLDQIHNVDPPQVGGKRVAFIYLFLAGKAWKLLFDATPNHGRVVRRPKNWRLGREIAAHLNEEMAKRAVGFHSSVENQTLKIGLWAAPALVPYPLAAISQKCLDGDLEAAKAILVAHCTPDFLAQRIAGWGADAAFRDRGDLFQEALAAHREGRFMSSVYLLVPQIEGVITDWAYASTMSKRVPRKHSDKIKKLRELLLQEGRLLALGRSLAKSLISFLDLGPAFENFEWFAPATAAEFPNRHVVGHGKFVRSNFTEEMSIKAILLLDTLHYLFNVDGK